MCSRKQAHKTTAWRFDEIKSVAKINSSPTRSGAVCTLHPTFLTSPAALACVNSTSPCESATPLLGRWRPEVYGLAITALSSRSCQQRGQPVARTQVSHTRWVRRNPGQRVVLRVESGGMSEIRQAGQEPLERTTEISHELG